MPLSDHEQKLLAQMEQALYAEDPKFATSMTGRRRGLRSMTRLTVGVSGLVLGLVVLVAGIVAGQEWLPVAVAGFLLMFVGAVVAVSGGPKRPTLTVVGQDGRRRPTRSRAGLVQRMEQRWERRRENGFQ